MECLRVMNTVDYKWEEGEVQTFLNLEIFRYGGIVSEQKKCVLVLQHIFVDCNDVYTLGGKALADILKTSGYTMGQHKFILFIVFTRINSDSHCTQKKDLAMGIGRQFG